MTNHSSHGHDHNAPHAHESDLAAMLDLDALLLREHMQEIFDWTSAHHRDPNTIVDLGAGSGTGTLGLARTFPAANIVAVDQSEFMLAHLASAVAKQELSDRVSTLQIDLDTAWPELTEVDLVWAASSMHHMSDPMHVLKRVDNMLASNGLLVVVEMDSLPRHLPDDLGFGASGLEQRLHDAAALAGWNSHPNWASTIREAGMEITEQRTFTYDTAENPDLITRNAQILLTRLRDGLEADLSAADLATLNQLLDPHGARSLTQRGDLALRGSRTVWAARPAR